MMEIGQTYKSKIVFHCAIHNMTHETVECVYCQAVRISRMSEDIIGLSNQIKELEKLIIEINEKLK